MLITDVVVKRGASRASRAGSSPFTVEEKSA